MTDTDSPQTSPKPLPQQGGEVGAAEPNSAETRTGLADALPRLLAQRTGGCATIPFAAIVAGIGYLVRWGFSDVMLAQVIGGVMLCTSALAVLCTLVGFCLPNPKPANVCAFVSAAIGLVVLLVGGPLGYLVLMVWLSTEV